MSDAPFKPEDERTPYNQPGWTVGTVNQTVVVQSDPATEELTPARLAAIEARYRAQVVERYNRLGFAGLGLGDLRLADVALDDVFVRLTLTVEKIVREPIPPEEWEREERSRNPFRRGQKKEDERPRERVVTVQQPISLGDTLAQHALIVGEPGAGKSTLLRWLAVTFAAGSQRGADRLGPSAEADRLPLLVELGRLPEVYLKAESRETPNWKTFLPEHLTKQPPFDDIPAPFLEQALAAGRCLLLCDGLDEIADLSARRRLADSLADYARSSANRLVLSSRPAGVSGGEGALGARFQRLTIQRFIPEEVRRFFGFLYAQNPELTPDEQKKEADALYGAVQAAPKTLELATTPLLAALLFAIWNENAYLPERRVELYERCCRMLIESWEAQHDVAYTGVLGEIGWERHLRLLAPLAYAIHNGGQRTDAPASELIPVLAQAMQSEGLATPASATLEAEKFLHTLSLRSGLLQFLGGDRYGFPHLTFQEYLTARHIAAQPDPDYIDTVMVHLHKAWWREVHLLVIGHLGSGSESADKASRLLHRILHLYTPPWWMLRSLGLNLRRFQIRDGLRQLLEESRILKWLVYAYIWGIAIPLVLPALARNILAARVGWQFERRLAWVLSREFTFAATALFDCTPLGTNAVVRRYLIESAQRLLLQIILDDGRIEIDAPVSLTWAAISLALLGQVSPGVVGVLVRALGASPSSWHMSFAAASSLTLLGQASPEVAGALVGALSDSSKLIRAAAASSLGQLGQVSPKVVGTLVGALGDSSFHVRAAAASSLVQLGQASPDVVGALVGALSDSSERIRVAAASSLIQLGQESTEALCALMRALDDPDWYVRAAAADGLGRVGQPSPETVGALVGALSDSSERVQLAAVSGLGELGQVSREAAGALVGALSDSSEHIRLAVADSLGKVGQASPEVVGALVGALGASDSDMREAAARSLGQMGQQWPEVAGALIGALRDSRWYVRKVAAGGLGKTRQTSPEVLGALLGVLGASDSDVREALAGDKDWFMVGLGSEIGEAFVSLWVASYSGVRAAAASSLGELGQGSREVVAALVSALGSSSELVRQAAASSLGQLGQASKEVVAALVGALGDSSGLVRQAAASSLGQLGQASKEVVAALVGALGDSSELVRQAAASSLGELGQGSRKVVAALVGALGDLSWSVEQAAVSSLGQLKIADEAQLRRVLIALNRRLHDESDDVRRAALTAIRQLLDGRPIPGYRWVPIRVRRQRAKRRQILGYWVLGISTAVLVAWVAAGLTTYLSLDEFWVRFVGALAAVVALAAGGVQVLGYFRRPPWDK